MDCHFSLSILHLPENLISETWTHAKGLRFDRWQHHYYVLFFSFTDLKQLVPASDTHCSTSLSLSPSSNSNSKPIFHKPPHVFKPILVRIERKYRSLCLLFVSWNRKTESFVGESLYIQIYKLVVSVPYIYAFPTIFLMHSDLLRWRVLLDFTL